LEIKGKKEDKLHENFPKTLTLADFRRLKITELKDLLRLNGKIFLICGDLLPIKVSYADLQ
jgi:hypothetical protein